MLTVAALLEPSLNLVFIIVTGALVPAAENTLKVSAFNVLGNQMNKKTISWATGYLQTWKVNFTE